MDSEEENESEYLRETFEYSYHGYQFKYKVFEFETKTSFSVTCDIRKNNEAIGNLEAWFISGRSCRSKFYEDCDAISMELQLISNILFHSTGTLRKHEWVLNEDQIMNGSRGGFPSIEEVNIQKAHRGKDLAFKCISKLLNYFSNRWSVCVVEPCYTDNKDQEEASVRKQINICRLFLRLGFHQIPKHSEYFYLLPANVKALSKHQVEDITIELEKENEKKPDPLVTKLVEGVTEATTQEDILKLLRDFQAKGLSLNDGCLHLAAHHGPVKLVELLMQEGVDINKKNDLGDTPLHACCRGSVRQQVYACLCTNPSLDKTIHNDSGYTPYDIMIQNINGKSCYNQTFCLKPRLEEVKPSYDLALALMPNKLKETLIEGLVSPRIFERLKVVAEIDNDMADFNPSDYRNGVRIDVHEIWNGICFNCLPKEITEGGVYKSFVSGFNNILLSISVIMNHGNQLPTKSRILQSLESSWPPNHIHFFENGGRIEHLIKGLFEMVQENCFEYGDGEFEVMHGELLDVLPQIPYFDEDYQYLNVIVYDYLVKH